MRARLVALCIVSTLLAACVSAPVEEEPRPAPPPPPSVAPPVAAPQPEPSIDESAPAVAVIVEPTPTVRALEYFARVRPRSARELKLEYDSLRRAFAGSKSDHDRIRLALLLSLPAAPFNDEAQALELLEPLTRDPSNEYHSLAQLLTTLLVEQRRRSSHAMALQQKLDRLMALEKEMQQRAATPESRPR